MQLAVALDESEAFTELGVEGVRRVTRHLEPAATRGSIFGERGDQYATARPHGAAHLLHVSGAIVCIGQCSHFTVAPMPMRACAIFRALAETSNTVTSR